jgi:glutamate synthase (NADPH/NADH) small chain
MTITEKREARTADSAGVDRPHVTVLLDRCAGCQECIIRCPTGALSLDPFTWTAVANDAACVGCRQCVRTCPFSAIVVEGPLVVDERIAFSARHPADLRHDHSETRQGISSWEAALSEASRCLDCPDPTCVRGCPAHNDIPGFIRAMRAGDLDEAHRILRRTSFMPDVCSRVCDWAIQCEGACTWSLAGGEPVAIGALERFVADNAPVPPLVPDPLAPGKDLDVAVVGSGPAGIGAASELVQAGARVTVYEREAEPGGLLRWGIPDFTLPDGVARRPWDTLVEAGVRLELRHEVSAAELDDLLARHDALILAAGASTPLWLPVPGSDLDRVWDATRFLTEARAALAEGRDLAELRPGGDGEPPLVLVLGAGNTAMDVARSARRFGARAICVDWMDRRYAPVRPDELNEAVEEGVEVRFCASRGLGDGSATPTWSGRARGVPLSGRRCWRARPKCCRSTWW